MHRTKRAIRPLTLALIQQNILLVLLSLSSVIFVILFISQNTALAKH